MSNKDIKSILKELLKDIDNASTKEELKEIEGYLNSFLVDEEIDKESENLSDMSLVHNTHEVLTNFKDNSRENENKEGIYNSIKYLIAACEVRIEEIEKHEKDIDKNIDYKEEKNITER